MPEPDVEAQLPAAPPVTVYISHAAPPATLFESLVRTFFNWTLDRRISRHEFWYGFAAVMASVIVAVYFATKHHHPMLAVVWIGVCGLITMKQAAARYHDLHLSGWWAVLQVAANALVGFLIYITEFQHLTDPSKRLPVNIADALVILAVVTFMSINFWMIIWAVRPGHDHENRFSH